MEWTEEQLQYLDDLRDSGITNMFGAGPFLQYLFGLDRKQAHELLAHWMETYSDRHPIEEE